MGKITRSEVEKNLVQSRESILEKLKNAFEGEATEAHVFGSIARGNADAHSDLDIWFTFKDDELDEVKKRRFEYYELAGEILNICEPPQNAPLGGICSVLLVRTKNEAITMIDLYLCPLSTSFITKEGKKLFGIDIRLGVMDGYNPQKIKVDEDYRISFFIGFIFNTIKKLTRGEQSPLDAVLHQYEKLRTDYGIPLDLLTSKEQNFTTLEKIIENTQKVANDKQKDTLAAISNFGRKIF